MPINWTKTQLTINHALRVRCEPAWELDQGWSERLDDFDLWCVWAGRGVMRMRERTVDLRPGVCILARPGGVYLARQERRERLGVNAIHFDLTDRRTGKRVAASRLPGEVHELIDAGYVDAVTRRIVELVRQGGKRQDAASSLLRGLLSDIDTRSDHGVDATMSATERHYHEVVAGIASRITTSPHDVPPIEQLAREAGYSVDHFARVFSKVTGRSPQAFIVDSRIDRARQLLRESSMTVSQIADVLGYRDVFFFSRQFKQKAGRPPSAFRAT